MQKYETTGLTRIGKQTFLLINVLLTLVLWAFPAAAQTSNSKSLILSNLYKEHYLSPYLTRYQNEGNNLSAEKIIGMSGIRANIADVSGSITLLGTDENAVWLSIDVMNRSSKAFWKIDFGSSFMGRFGLLDKVESYTFNKITKESWENEIQDDGSILLELPMNEKSQILLKFESAQGLPLSLPLRLLHQDKKIAVEENFTMTFIMTLLVGMAFFFGAIALVTATVQYLFFSLYYLLLTGFLFVQNDCVIFEFLFIGSEFVPFAFLLIAITGLMTSRIFWNMEDSSKLANTGFYSLIGLSIVAFMGGSFFSLELPFVSTVLFFAPSLLIFIIMPLVSITLSQQGNDEATPFMFGWFILLFGICITMLSLSGIMQPVSTAINAYWYTLVPQALFFIFAVNTKMKQENSGITMSKTLEIDETDSMSRLRQSKENTEQERLLKVIEQERKVLGELRKSEARRTDEMRKAKEEADIANNAKSAFLAVVSHEIRTPMTGIMGMVRLLLDSKLTKDQKEYAQTIQDSSDAMLALLNDILDFEKIEQGKMIFENISFDLHRIIQGVSTLMNGHAQQKGIELKIKLGDNLPRYVKGDPNRLRQVLLNLTGNAVKFTTEGSVTITSELMKTAPDGDKHEIYFGVTDSGIGISAEAQKNLFNPFSQADSSISRKFGGTGLGLAISRGLVQGMGSNININSNEGEGSTFFFTLNMAAGQSSEATRVKQEREKTSQFSQALKILVVDDNEINRKVVEGFLEKEPHKMDTATSAEEALQKVTEQTFNLILMDIEMPGMKGDEASRRIRQSDDPRIKKIPIVALTGNVMPDDLERFRDAGMNGHLAKPIDPASLKEILAKTALGKLDNPDMIVKEEDKGPQPLMLEEDDKEEDKKKSPQSHTSVVEGNIEVPVKKDPVVFNPANMDSLKSHLSEKDIKDMLDDLLKKTDEIIAGMNKALEDQNADEILAKGHELKGMAGNFGLEELSHQAGEIEEKAKSQPIIILTGLVTPLPEMKKKAQAELNEWLSRI